MKNARQFFLSFLILGAGLLAFSAAGSAEEGGKYYTKVNIWYEKPQKIFSTNYHKGTLLPVGSEVEIIKRSRKKIQFREKSSGTEFRIVLVKDFTKLNETEFFDRYLSKENVLNGSAYAAFSALDKENIKTGTLSEGMSKAAVLIAYGYPPTHRTPSTDENVWIYWKHRFGNFRVQFKDDKVAYIGR